MTDTTRGLRPIPLLLAALAGALLIFTAPRAAGAAQGDCGQPVSDGDSPLASDALHILRTAVGSDTCTPVCICNVDHTAGVTAQDALLCLQAAVGLDVVLDCGDGCPSATTTTTLPATTTTLPPTTTTSTVPGPTTTTTLPSPPTAHFAVMTRSEGEYATANLLGSWDLNALATGPGAPYYSRGNIVIQSSGSFAGSITDLDEFTESISGKFALSQQGILQCSSGYCPAMFEGAMDSDNTVMSVTFTWDDGTTELLIATRRGSYVKNDIAATWEMNALTSGHEEGTWKRGTLVTQTGGYTSGQLRTGEGLFQFFSATLSLSGNGMITCVNGCPADFHGSLDKGKTLAGVTQTEPGGGAAALAAMTRKGSDYEQADLAGTWRVNDLGSGPHAAYWARGAITVEADGTFSGSLTASDGSDRNAAGKLTLGSDGIATAKGGGDFRCALDSGKTVMVCTGSALP